MAVFTGETVEKAIDRGLTRLGVSREKVHIQIEQHEKKGFLGFGTKRARVNIEVIDDETVRKADRQVMRASGQDNLGGEVIKSTMEMTIELSNVVKAVKEAEKNSDRELTDEEKTIIMEEAKTALAADQFIDKQKEIIEDETLTEEIEEIVEEDIEDLKPISQKVSDYLQDIAKGMGIDADVIIHDNEVSEVLVFELTSEQDGLLIGKHGKLLQSLQTLSQTYAATLSDSYIKVLVDVAGYLDKREDFVRSVSRKAIEQARSGEVAYINDLQSYERKMVHSLVAKEAGISSYSEGKDSRRYVVVRKDF